MTTDLVEFRPIESYPDLSALRGSTQPRLWTPPLRPLTPETSYGYAVITFARDVLRAPLDPWEEFFVIHAGELLPDGLTPRFRTVLGIVARQNGKTHIAKVLTLFWLFVEKWPMTLATANKLEYAKEAFMQTVRLAENTPSLASDIKQILRGSGDVRVTTFDQAVYKIAANNADAGRSLSIDRLIFDELRTHYTREAWDAAVPAMNARPRAQLLAITNAGTDRSVVLNDLRRTALAGADPRLAILEWSAPDGSDPMDPAAWVAANPNLGHRLAAETIAAQARSAQLNGGLELAGFLTESLCMKITSFNGAIDPAAWKRGCVPGTLDDHRSNLFACLDVSPDWKHASLCVAALMGSGMVRVELVGSWSGDLATANARVELPDLLARIKPRMFGWFPTGPAAVLTADLKSSPDGRRNGWPPPGVTVSEIRADAQAACMGLAEQVNSGGLVHSGQELLDDHVLKAEKLTSGSRWQFSRKSGYCDAAYAAAGAVHLARTAAGKRSTRMPDLDFSVL